MGNVDKAFAVVNIGDSKQAQTVSALIRVVSGQRLGAVQPCHGSHRVAINGLWQRHVHSMWRDLLTI